VRKLAAGLLLCLAIGPALAQTRTVNCGDPNQVNVRDCPQEYYPHPIRPNQAVVDGLKPFYQDARKAATAAWDAEKLAKQKLKKAESWRTPPWARDELREQALKLQRDAKLKKHRMYVLMNLALKKTMLAYKLWPVDMSAGSSGAKDWSPRYSESETCESGQTHCRRQTPKEIEDAGFRRQAGMSVDGAIGIFNAPFFSHVFELMSGGPDRVALSVLHETVHWIDRVSLGRRLTPREKAFSEYRAYRKEADYAQSFGKGVFPKRFIDKSTETAATYLEIAQKIPPNLKVLPEGFRKDLKEKYGSYESEELPDEANEPEPGDPELIKTEGDAKFFKDVGEETERIQRAIAAANARSKRNWRERKQRQFDIDTWLEKERIRDTAIARGDWSKGHSQAMMRSFTMHICNFYEGGTTPPSEERVKFILANIVEDWFKNSRDPSPMGNFMSCEEWLARKLEFFCGRGERWLTWERLDKLWMMFQKEDRAVQKRLTPMKPPKAIVQPRARTPQQKPDDREKPKKDRPILLPPIQSEPISPDNPEKKLAKPGCDIRDGVEICPKNLDPDAWE